MPASHVIQPSQQNGVNGINNPELHDSLVHYEPYLNILSLVSVTGEENPHNTSCLSSLFRNIQPVMSCQQMNIHQPFAPTDLLSSQPSPSSDQSPRSSNLTLENTWKVLKTF